MATKDITDLQVCEAFYLVALQRRINPAEQNKPIDILNSLTHEPLKVCAGAIQRATKRGLIVDTTLTDSGRAFLRGQGVG